MAAFRNYTTTPRRSDEVHYNPSYAWLGGDYNIGEWHLHADVDREIITLSHPAFHTVRMAGDKAREILRSWTISMLRMISQPRMSGSVISVSTYVSPLIRRECRLGGWFHDISHVVSVHRLLILMRGQTSSTLCHSGKWIRRSPLVCLMVISSSERVCRS